jgi:hypothetical protein
MRVKEIKSELDSLRVSTSDVFEKEERVQRLYSARIMQQRGIETNSNDVVDDQDDELIKKKKQSLNRNLKKRPRRIIDHYGNTFYYLKIISQHHSDR